MAGTDATTTACCGGASCRTLVYRGRIRARTGAEILAVTQRLPGARPRLSVPLLVLHGTDDRICPLAGSVMVHEAVSSADKTLRRYPGLCHEVFNEPQREQILTDLISGLRCTCPATDPLRIQRPERISALLFTPRPLKAACLAAPRPTGRPGKPAPQTSPPPRRCATVRGSSSHRELRWSDVDMRYKHGCPTGSNCRETCRASECLQDRARSWWPVFVLAAGGGCGI
jgi:hypothetical protein